LPILFREPPSPLPLPSASSLGSSPHDLSPKHNYKGKKPVSIGDNIKLKDVNNIIT
jgi:hypothetical protein